jgi:hypothetical protein
MAKADEQRRDRRRTILDPLLSTTSSRIIILTFEEPSQCP